MTSEREALEALAKRCEAATGADRGLDAAIHEWLCDGFEMMPDASMSDVEALLPADVDAAAFAEACGGFADVVVPRYTGSLDAAMALAGDGFWRLSVPIDGEDGVGFVGVVMYTNEWNETEPAFGTTATPALALCAAALRSRACSTDRAE